MTEDKSKYQAQEMIPHIAGPTPYQYAFRAKHAGRCCLCLREYPAQSVLVKLKEPKISVWDIASGPMKHHTRETKHWYAHKACADGRPQDAEVFDDASE